MIIKKPYIRKIYLSMSFDIDGLMVSFSKS
jgi:hypothetical protein